MSLNEGNIDRAAVSQSMDFAYLGDKVFGIWANLYAVFGFLGPTNRRILNQVIHLVLVWIVKWRYSDYHLIDKNSERPPVQCLVMA